MTNQPADPNIIPDEAYELEPFRFRLYAHYLRACQRNGGTCRETVRETAEAARISVGEVSEVRKRLADDGWIELSPYAGNQPRTVWIAERSPREHETASAVHHMNMAPSPLPATAPAAEHENADNGVACSPPEHDVHQMNTSSSEDSSLQDPDSTDLTQKRGRKKPAMHPAVAAYHSQTILRPPRNWEAKVIEAVGDDPQRIENWRLTVESWMGRHWKPGNVKGMLERYEAGDYHCNQFGSASARPNGAGAHSDKGEEEDADLAARQRAYLAERVKKRDAH